jgi:hypothetical protein
MPGFTPSESIEEAPDRLDQGSALMKPHVTTGASTAIGMTGFTANGIVDPRGSYTHCYFEYGTSSTYGWRTEPTPLPARRAAHYTESWEENVAGWPAYFGGGRQHLSDGGPSKGFLRITEQALVNDFNHDASGVLHLMTGTDTGPVEPEGSVLGGGDGDLRDAHVSLYLRGNDWQPNGSEFGFWLQCQSNIELMNNRGWKRSNNSYCGCPLTDYLMDGKWHKVEFDLINDSTLWTYGGNNSIQQGPSAVRYEYWPIDQCLAHANCNVIFLSTFVNPENPPTGSVDFDELEITYCNRSLVFPGNGGELKTWPDGSDDDPATLTDGWRFGEGRMWRSKADPTTTQEFVYRFDHEVTVDSIQLHQHTEWPAKEVEVLTSQDGSDFAPLLTGSHVMVPESSPDGPNHAFLFERGLSARARFLKVRLLSGYRDRCWGLGEIEIFGSGAELPHDDIEQHVGAEVKGLTPGSTCHYRLVAENESGTSFGEERVFSVPALPKPLASTGAATRVTATTAKLGGRMNPMGCYTHYFFQYGQDLDYRDTPFEHATVATVHRKRLLKVSPQAVQLPLPGTYAGLQQTMRTVVDNLEDLDPDTTYHYRLVAVNQHGVTYGDDATFATAAR